ncbi:MAG: carbohydrate-binding family 9-like protein [Bianqueaceae bacterium]
MEYKIMTVTELPDWSLIPQAQIATYPWGGEYRPLAWARLCFVPGRGFLLRLECEETDPKATYAKINDPVCKDSCLEAFLNFKPELPGCGYLNLEANAKGTFLCGYGKDRYGRKSLGDLRCRINGDAFSTESSWGRSQIPLPLLQQVYRRRSLCLRRIGKFYKCGDETKTPHYGSWNPIENPTPDFHRPEGFGELVILP